MPSTAQLRTYPPRFGFRLVRLHDAFCRNRVIPEPCDSILEMSAHTIFHILEWGDLWEDAGAVEILQWIRGNKHLQLGEWRELFPTRL